MCVVYTLLRVKAAELKHLVIREGYEYIRIHVQILYITFRRILYKYHENVGK